MSGIDDLMTPEDADELRRRFDAAIREVNEHEDEIGNGFRRTIQREVFDWEIDLDIDFFD